MTFNSWYQAKLFIEHATGVSMDALHIVVGLILFLLTARLLRKSVASWLPWLALLSLELGNEIYDLTVERWPDPGQQFGEGTKDILLTMALPTMLMLVSRWRPTLLVKHDFERPLANDDVANRPDVRAANGAPARLDNERQAHGEDRTECG